MLQKNFKGKLRMKETNKRTVFQVNNHPLNTKNQKPQLLVQVLQTKLRKKKRRKIPMH